MLYVLVLSWFLPCPRQIQRILTCSAVKVERWVDRRCNLGDLTIWCELVTSTANFIFGCMIPHEYIYYSLRPEKIVRFCFNRVQCKRSVCKIRKIYLVRKLVSSTTIKSTHLLRKSEQSRAVATLKPVFITKLDFFTRRALTMLMETTLFTLLRVYRSS